MSSGALPARYSEVQDELRLHPRKWLVTGAAGFIGSNLVELLLGLDQSVVGLDNFATGRSSNLEDVRRCIDERRWARFRFIEGDIREADTCLEACRGIDVVLHQAALGSVPRSLEDPVSTNQANIDGTLHMLVAARDSGVHRFVYAASSSTYGDEPALPKVEDRIGRPLSPYAVTKYVGELYAGVFHRCYGLESIGLRYFNVFGRRQDPAGAYAAVIPKWVDQLIGGRPCRIYGDGETSRDFCYIDNVLQANLLAAAADVSATGEVYNVAVGERTTLNELFRAIRDELLVRFREVAKMEPEYAPFRAGDIRHSLANISKIQERLRYHPTHGLRDGLHEAIGWYATTPRPPIAAMQAGA
ncbi:MAG: SDR family oxidoreductase [Gemmatimonadales bacterium]